MAATLGEVSVTLLMNINQFLTGSKTAQTDIAAIEKQGLSATSKLSANFGSLFKTIGGGLIVFGLLKRGLVDSVKAYIEAKDSSDRLTAALDGSIDKAREFEQIAGRIQSMTIYGDELVQDGFTFLAGQQRTEEQMKKTMDAAVDYAAFMKKDLLTAVKELSMTYDGNLGRLTRIHGGLKDLTPEQLRNGAAIDMLAEKYRGWGEIIGNTVEGKVRRLQNAMDELQEGIGSGFMEGLAEDFDSVSNSILGTTTSAKDLGIIFGQTLGYVLQLVTGVKLLGTVFGIVINAVTKLKPVMRELTDTVGTFAVKLLELPSKLPIIGDFFDELKFYAEKYKNKLLEIIGLQKALTEGKAQFDKQEYDEKYIGTAKDPTANTGTKSKAPTGNTKQLKEEKKELDEIEKLREEINKLEAEHQVSLAKYGPEINKFLKGQIDKIKELKSELADLLSIEKERAREYEKNSRADGTLEMAEGTSRPGARPEAAIMPNENDWIKFWVIGLKHAEAISNILNRKPENLIDSFVMILQIVTQIAQSMNSSGGGGFSGILSLLGLIPGFGSLFGAFGNLLSIFGFKDGGNLSEGIIRGPGTSTSDSILARAGNRMIRLSNEEYIVPAWMNFLYPLLDEIRLSRGSVSSRNSFASGGGLSSPALKSIFNAGNIFIYEDAVVTEAFSRKVVTTGMPGYNIMKKKRGSRS